MKVLTKLIRRPDGQYRAWCPALPGCTINADSQQEAQDKIERAVRGYLASLDVALPRELERMAHIV